MASAVVPNDEHLETFCLIWLDAGADVMGTRNTEQKLRSVINHVKKFQNVPQCQQYIEHSSQKNRLILIASGRLGQEIVPSIHKLRQVISIYVYCMDKKRNEQWTSKFPKVKAVIVELEELVSRITADHKIQKKVEEPLSISVFTTSGGAGKSTIGVNGQFVFSQVLIDCLLRLKSTQTDKQELFSVCKNAYEGNSGELNNIREFQQDYLPDKVLWWYTRESFFYKSLNAVLRTQNIHMIFLFRGFICDIHRQLQHYQAKHFLRVYRSQMISNDELKTLKQCVGQFISINSFFSTSTEKSKALSFLWTSETSGDLQRILFEIDADPKKVTTKPFAEIKEHSDFPDESEVLFMLGVIFRLESINRNDDQIWIIRMTLCSDEEHDLKQVLTYMKQQTGSGDTNLRTLGKILWKMGKLDLAEKYFKRLLKELPSNDPLLSSLYEDLGELASQTGDYDMSVQWHQKSLACKGENQQTDKPTVNKTNSSFDKSSYDMNGQKHQKSLASKQQNQSTANPQVNKTKISSGTKNTTTCQQCYTKLALTIAYKEGQKINCSACNKAYIEITCPHCSKLNVWRDADRKEGEIIPCHSCKAQFQHLNCPNCMEAIIWKNADYTPGLKTPCWSCKKQFQHVDCPNCSKSNYWNNADYVEGLKVPCWSCKKQFQHLNCPHCSKPNYWKNADRFEGAKAPCWSCKRHYQHVNCPHCTEPNVWKNADYIQGAEVSCCSCKKKFQYLNCPHCSKSNFWKKGEYQQRCIVTCYACHHRFQHVACAHCDAGNFFNNADLNSYSQVKCYSCSQMF